MSAERIEEPRESCRGDMGRTETAALWSSPRLRVWFSPDGNYATWAMHDGHRWQIVRHGADGPATTWLLPPAEAQPAELSVDRTGVITVLLPERDPPGSRVLRLVEDERGSVVLPGALVEAPHCELVQGVAGLAVGHGDGVSTVWSVPPGEDARLIHTTDGMLSGGRSLDHAGVHIAFNLLHGDGECQPVRLDRRHSTLTALVPGRTNLQLLLVRPGTRSLLFAVDIRSNPSLTIGELNESGTAVTAELKPLVSLNALDGELLPLTFDSGAEHLYVAVNRGVRSRLYRYRVADDANEEIDIPVGVIDNPGTTRGGTVHFPFTTPDLPWTIASLSDPGSGRRTTLTAAEVGERSSGGAVVTTFSTTDGEVEALVYGKPWEAADRILFALHGGPEAHWRAEYSPVFHQMTARGITVIAINQRGSTGYGQHHQAAIQHAWGGPDLADIECVARFIAHHRGEGCQFMLYGASYGAYLALLTASTTPELWSHCVAVAPFLSGQRLYRQAEPPVRRLVERLGGRTVIRDHYGPRDLLRITRTLRAKTLLVHGSADWIIPVSHSRQLYQHLTRCGTCAELRYIEVPDAGHSPQYDDNGCPMSRRIVDFLSE